MKKITKKAMYEAIAEAMDTGSCKFSPDAVKEFCMNEIELLDKKAAKAKERAAAKKAAAAVAKYAQEHPNAKLTAEITGGALAATGAAYGGYKLYDHIKNKNKD